MKMFSACDILRVRATFESRSTTNLLKLLTLLKLLLKMSNERRPSDEPPSSEPVDVSASAATGSNKRKRAETEVDGGGVENAAALIPDWVTGW
jgi:hypothetical protein